MEKLKAGIFDDFQIRELMRDPKFNEALSEAQPSTWYSQTSRESTREWNTRRKLKRYRRVSANSSVKLNFFAVTLGLFYKEL